MNKILGASANVADLKVAAPISGTNISTAQLSSLMEWSSFEIVMERPRVNTFHII